LRRLCNLCSLVLPLEERERERGWAKEQFSCSSLKFSVEARESNLRKNISTDY
jgi:hypothetical protein